MTVEDRAMTDNPKLIAAGKELDLKFTPATEGNGGYDISALLKETGNVTLDAGFQHRELHQRDHLHRR